MENQEPIPEGFLRKSKSFDDYYNDPTHPYAMVKVFIDGEELKTSFTVEFTQRTNDHDTFKIITPDDSFDSFEGYILEKSRHLFGKNVMIQFARFGKVTQTFEGIITNINNPKHDGGGYGDLHIIGAGTSILLESGKDCRSFENKSLDQIIKEVCENYPREAKVEATLNQLNLDNRFPIHYTVQYKESDYEFIKRLAKLHGEFFYYTGDKLIFGNTAQDYIKIQENSDLAQETFYASLLAQDFKYLAYNPETGEVIEKESQKVKTEFKENHFGAMAVIASRKIFPKKPVMQFNNAKNERELEKAVRLEREKRENLFFVKGKSRAPELKIGGRAELSDINGKAMETYRVIEIRHYHDGYDYYNEFIGIPDLFYASPFIDTEAFPVGEIQSARVMDNNDPKGMGRVRVQFPWQMATNQMTPWIHVVTPHAGANKGIYFPPEIGEEVLINYENNNAEKPFVMGAMYNGAEKSGYHTSGNDLKAIHTRSNNKIVMNDSEKSLLMEDGSQSFFKMKGNRTAEINTDVLEINVKKLIINASQTTEITTNDYVLNALSKIYVFSNFMKQHINGFMHLFSNKALINSLNTIDIEAKEAKLHGTEKAVMNSDKTALINSKGTAEMHGVQGNNQTNVAQDIKTTATDKIALAEVHFRPKFWHGQYGFDCFIDAENNFDNEEPAYETVILSGYKEKFVYDKFGGKTGSNFSKEEALEKFKNQYKTVPIARKNNAVDKTYYVPYLSLFSKKFVDTYKIQHPETKSEFPDNMNDALPKYMAEMEVWLDVEDEVDSFQIVYDENFFSVSEINIPTKKTEKLIKLEACLTITCKKDLVGDMEISIYAIPKGYTNKETERKLAGKIIVIKNDASVRKEENIVVIKTKFNDLAEPLDEVRWDSLYYLRNTLHQALIIPNIKIINFELPRAKQNLFMPNGDFMDKGNLWRDEKKSAALKKLQEIFLEEHSEYSSHFTIFILPMDSDKPRLGGHVQDIGIRNVAVMKNGTSGSTLGHEFMHGMGLYHTHYEFDLTKQMEENRKYVFTDNATRNVMSYSVDEKEKIYLWRWQWHIANPKISEK